MSHYAQRKPTHRPPAPPIARCKAGRLALYRAAGGHRMRAPRAPPDRSDPDAWNRAREEAWRNPFPGATPEACIAALRRDHAIHRRFLPGLLTRTPHPCSAAYIPSLE